MNCFRVLYLFAGVKRRNSVADLFKRKAKALNFTVQILEVDILRNRRMDLSLHERQQPLLNRIQEGHFNAVLASPPCSTFSRAPWSNKLGPRPVRSFEHLRGFPWLRWKQKQQAQLGNRLADFALEALHAQLQLEDGIALLEQPEDLGAVRRGPWPGKRPGSIWQFPKIAELVDLPAVHYGAFHQSSFGTCYPKPTRILYRLSGRLDNRIFLGPPTFDAEGYYTGPLARSSTATSSLVRKSGESGFKATGTASWPK